MKNIFKKILPALAFILTAAFAKAESVLDLIQKSQEHTVLANLIQTSGLSDMFSKDEPMTLFAPTDAAFAKLPPGTVENLLKPENKEKLVKLLNYHMLAEEVESDALANAVKNNDGEVEIKTEAEGTVKLTLDDNDQIVVTDENGDKGTVTKKDMKAANGVVHALDNVVIPQ